jgi:hypothetical protein
MPTPDTLYDVGTDRIEIAAFNSSYIVVRVSIAAERIYWVVA